MFTYRDYGEVDSFLPEDDIARRRRVIKFMRLLTRLGLNSPDDFLDCPVFDNDPWYHAYQGMDGRRGRTMY